MYTSYAQVCSRLGDLAHYFLCWIPFHIPDISVSCIDGLYLSQLSLSPSRFIFQPMVTLPLSPFLSHFHSLPHYPSPFHLHQLSLRPSLTIALTFSSPLIFSPFLPPLISLPLPLLLPSLSLSLSSSLPSPSPS